jgi:hypothetical protein
MCIVPWQEQSVPGKDLQQFSARCDFAAMCALSNKYVGFIGRPVPSHDALALPEECPRYDCSHRPEANDRYIKANAAIVRGEQGSITSAAGLENVVGACVRFAARLTAMIDLTAIDIHVHIQSSCRLLAETQSHSAPAVCIARAHACH